VCAADFNSALGPAAPFALVKPLAVLVTVTVSANMAMAFVAALASMRPSLLTVPSRKREPCSVPVTDAPTSTLMVLLFRPRHHQPPKHFRVSPTSINPVRYGAPFGTQAPLICADKPR
jgi:hypothetical protein